MAGRLDGTVALVTGASSGIGEATARTLAAEGAAVAIVARRRKRLDQLAKDLQGGGGRALVLDADVTQEAQAREAAERTAREPRRVADLVNISSVAGRAARSGSGVYNLTKFGVGAFSESLRQEVTRRHVRVSLVEPGAVITELTDHLRPEIKEQTKGLFADTERLEAQDIADAITYIVTRPRRVAINEVLVRPTEQER